MKKILIAILFIAMFPVVVFAFNLHGKRPSVKKWCFDYAKVFKQDVEEDINDEGHSIQRSFDIDFVVVTVPNLGGKGYCWIYGRSILPLGNWKKYPREKRHSYLDC